MVHCKSKLFKQNIHTLAICLLLECKVIHITALITFVHLYCWYFREILHVWKCHSVTATFEFSPLSSPLLFLVLCLYYFITPRFCLWLCPTAAVQNINTNNNDGASYNISLLEPTTSLYHPLWGPIVESRILKFVKSNVFSLTLACRRKNY